MKHLRYLALATAILITGACNAPQSDTGVPPNTAIVPVQQDASWAVEWWLPRHEEKLELAKTADIDLLMIGDSITHGWETGGNAVWQEYYAGRNAFNLGFSGDRTEHVLWRLQNGAVDGMSPKLIVMMIGTNNTGHFMDEAEHTADGIGHIVAEFRERMPDARILLLGIFPRHDSPNNDMRLRNDAINSLVAEMADGDKVHYLDVGPAFLEEDGTLLPGIMPDELHPNAEGYALWAEAMEPTIEELMN